MAFGGGRPMSGVLGGDFNDPRTQGILGLAGGLLTAGGPSVGRPISIGQALGMGINQGQTAFNAAQQRADRLAQIQRQEERQKRLDEQAALKNRFQVVGGNLFDMTGDSPQLVELPGRLSEQVSSDGRLIYSTDATGKTTVRKSNLFDELTEQKDKSKKPTVLSSKAQSAEDDDFYAIDTSQGILKDIDRFAGLIDDDKLSFGFGEGIMDSVLQTVGAAGEEEINSAQFNTFLEKLRNDTLRLNKGVQTEGDAQRALNEIIANKNDTKVVRAQLARLRDINERAIEIRKRNINRRRKTQNVDSFDFSDYAAPTTESDVGFTIK